jgi:hypothetical protein
METFRFTPRNQYGASIPQVQNPSLPSQRFFLPLIPSLLKTIAGSILTFTVSCANLPAIEENRCGNAVREGEEQCDGYAPNGLYCRLPGVANECEFDCSIEIDGVRATCPLGSKCGTNGLCRYETGEYAPWGNDLTTSAARLLLGDFDGDGREDIVTLGNPTPRWDALPTLFFLDDEGNPDGYFAPKIPIRSPQVSPLGPTDENIVAQRLVFSTREGLASLSASPNRVVLPDAYPYQSVPLGMRYRVLAISGTTGNKLGDGILIFFSTDTQTVLIGADSGTQVMELRTIDDFVGNLVTADLDRRPTSPCSELLFGYKNEGAIYSVDPCNAFGAWNQVEGPPRVIARLPENRTVSETILSADFNSDGHLDIVVGDNEGQVYVGFGLGDGSIVGNPEASDETRGQLSNLIVEVPGVTTNTRSRGFPLAVGNLDGIKYVDWVFADGVLLTKGLKFDSVTKSVTISAKTSNTPFVGRWAIAQLGDFNRDGLLDLAAAASKEPDLDLYMGTGFSMMNRFGISTEGVVTQMATGDFDGNLTQDLVFSVVTPANDALKATRDELVYIAFGEQGGMPTNATAIGAFKNIRQLCTAHYVDTDAISEIGVVSQSDSEQGEDLAVFIGNTGRHPIAPLGLSVMDRTGINYWGDPLVVATGHFFDAKVNSVIAIGVSCDGPSSTCSTDSTYQLWYAAGSTDAGLKYPRVSQSLPKEFSPYLAATDEFAIHVVAGNLDDDTSSDPKSKFDELLLFATTNTDKPNINLWSVNLGEESETFSTNPDASVGKTSDLLKNHTKIDGSLVANSNPTLVDLNNDHYRDLAFLASNPAGNSVLYFVYNERGKFNVSRSVVVDFGDEVPLSIFGRTENGQNLLLAVTLEHVFEITSNNGTPKATPFVGIPGGKAVAYGDLTGDGLNDLVVANKGKLRFYAQKSALTPTKEPE